MVTKVGNIVQGFYNKTPFPDYDLIRFNDKEDLRIVAYPFAKVLDRSIPQGASVIDVGTGTGQLSAFLSLRRECVFGIDFSDSSLNKAKALKKKLNLDSWNLKKIDILDEKQIDSIGMKFDYVLCIGVLHHTGDAYKGFKNNNAIKDWFIRMQIGDVEDKERARGWWNDQYLHPHETTHTVGEVLRWFKKNNIEY